MTTETFLTKKQLEYLEDYLEKGSMRRVAEAHGVDRSTVQRTVKRAVRNVEKAENTVELVETENIDMDRVDILKRLG